MKSNDEVIRALLSAAETLERTERNERKERGSRSVRAAADPIGLAKEITDKKLNHPAFRAITEHLDDNEKFLKKADKENQGMARIGGANMHLPRMYREKLVRMIRELSDTASIVADQLDSRLKQNQW